MIVISLDTLRADRIGAYGAYRPTTPAIDALAAESVVFEQAWSVWPETSGSHMSIFTSRLPSEHGVTSFIAAPAASIELLAERLRRERYLTRAFTEDGGVWANSGFARGFSAYGERRSADFVYHGEAAATFADATRWIEAHRDRTFFLFVHTYQVHAPYSPPKAYRTLFDEHARTRGCRLRAERAEVRSRDPLHRRPGRDRSSPRSGGSGSRSARSSSLLSDHGEEFGEHGGMGHGRTLHRELLHVPLIVWAPGLLAPARPTAPVSLLDVAPTVLDLLGLAPDRGHRGVSLAAAAARRRGRPRDGRSSARSTAPTRSTTTTSAPSRYGKAVGPRSPTALPGSPAATARTIRASSGRSPTAVPSPRRSREHIAAMPSHAAAHTVPADPRTIEKMRALGYVE